MPRAKACSMVMESDSSVKTSAAAVRIRENQRRSRARRKEYVDGMQRKLQDFESKGVAATLEMQQAARDIAIENSRLRLLLAHHGVNNEAIDGFLHSFQGQDPAEAEVQAARIAAAESVAALRQVSTMATLFPEHAHVDKLAVLASASVQQGCSEGRSQGIVSPDDSTAAPSTGPVTPNSNSLNTPPAGDQDFDSAMDMSCDAAAQIIAQMQGCVDHELTKESLGRNGKQHYIVHNSAFLSFLEAAATIDCA